LQKIDLSLNIKVVFKGVAVKAIKEMHQIIHEGLEDVLDNLLASESSFETQLNTTLHHKTNGLEGKEKKVKIQNLLRI